MLLHPQAASFTLKAFRAGRASQMTREGASWQEIQAAGEWRGLSSLSYISKPAIDDYASLMMTVDASSDEEPDVTKSLSLVLDGFRFFDHYPWFQGRVVYPGTHGYRRMGGVGCSVGCDCLHIVDNVVVLPNATPGSWCK